MEKYLPYLTDGAGGEEMWDLREEEGTAGKCMRMTPGVTSSVQGALQPPHCSEVSCVINTGLQVRKRTSGLWLGARSWVDPAVLLFH